MKRIDPNLSDSVRTMSDRRRALFQAVIGNDVNGLAQTCHYLYSHFPEAKLDAALAHLVTINLVGSRLSDFIFEKCDGSNLELHRQLLSWIDNANLRPILAGRDFRP